MTSIECQCESNFTCGYCLRNAKPWHFTLSDGSAIVGCSPGRFAVLTAKLDKGVSMENAYEKTEGKDDD